MSLGKGRGGEGGRRRLQVTGYCGPTRSSLLGEGVVGQRSTPTTATTQCTPCQEESGAAPACREGGRALLHVQQAKGEGLTHSRCGHCCRSPGRDGSGIYLHQSRSNV